MKTPDVILMQLKCLGPHSAQMLAERLSITTMGVRQHLHTLERRELVCYEEVRTKVGRPARFWSLTTQGHAKFANHHDQLAANLLNSAKSLFGAEGVEQLVDMRTEKLYQQYMPAFHDATDPQGKLNVLSQLRQRDGYMTELIAEEDNSFVLIENHCPIGVAATNCSYLCNAEIQLFQRLLGPQYHIQRTSHIISGARHCAYRITPQES